MISYIKIKSISLYDDTFMEYIKKKMTKRDYYLDMAINAAIECVKKKKGIELEGKDRLRLLIKNNIILFKKNLPYCFIV